MRKRARDLFAVFLFLSLLLLLASACSRPQPNLLLISLDTTRADHLSAYGYPRNTTPHLDRLAAEGARFAQSYSSSASTAPSHASLFTSLYPPSHGVVKNGIELSSAPITLAELMRDRGYDTHGIAGSFVLSRRFGYHRGFATWEDDFDPKTSTSKAKRTWQSFDVTRGFDRRANATTDRAIRWLETRAGSAKPFFLFVHYFDPHAPYVPPEPFARRFASDSNDSNDPGIGLYDGEIAFTDDQVGRLLAWLEAERLLDDTLVIVTGDHGEGLMDRGYAHHGVHIYDEGVRVPLIMRLPSLIAGGQVVESPVSGVDLLPSVAEMLLGEVPEPERFQGISFASALREGREPDPDRPIYLTRRHYEPRKVGKVLVQGLRYALRQGRWKYFGASEQGRAELYDLQEDPGERNDLVKTKAVRAAELAKTLAAWRAGHGEIDASVDLSDAERSALEALGYIE